jgi:hypothetical protein
MRGRLWGGQERPGWPPRWGVGVSATRATVGPGAASWAISEGPLPVGSVVTCRDGQMGNLRMSEPGVVQGAVGRAVGKAVPGSLPAHMVGLPDAGKGVRVGGGPGGGLIITPRRRAYRSDAGSRIATPTRSATHAKRPSQRLRPGPSQTTRDERRRRMKGDLSFLFDFIHVDFRTCTQHFNDGGAGRSGSCCPGPSRSRPTVRPEHTRVRSW